MATLFTRQIASQSASASKSGVKVPNGRTGCGSRSGGTAAQISRAPMSNPAASGWSGAQGSSALPGGRRRGDPFDFDLRFMRLGLLAHAPTRFRRICVRCSSGSALPPPVGQSRGTRTILSIGLVGTTDRAVLACRAFVLSLHPPLSFCRRQWRDAPLILSMTRRYSLTYPFFRLLNPLEVPLRLSERQQPRTGKWRPAIIRATLNVEASHCGGRAGGQMDGVLHPFGHGEVAITPTQLRLQSGEEVIEAAIPLHHYFHPRNLFPIRVH